MAMQTNGTPDGLAPNQQTPSENPTGREPAPFEPELPRWAKKASNSASLIETRLAAFIGPRWESSYRAKLARFTEDPSFTPTWNWAAAFGSPFWFIYRKLYVAFAAFVLIPGFALRYVTNSTDVLTLQNASSPEGQQLAAMFLAISASSIIAAGGTANWLLFRKARAVTAVVTLQQLPEEAAIAVLRRVGGVNLLPAILFLVLTLVINLAGVLAPRS